MAKEGGQVDMVMEGGGMDGSIFGKMSRIAPTTIHAEESNTTNSPKTKAARRCCSILFLLLFSFHLFLVFILIIFLIFRGLILASNRHMFHPIHWYLPLLTSSACAVIFPMPWLAAVHYHPERTIKAAFWLSPLLTFTASIVALSIGTTSGLTVSAFAIIFALVQSLYACWVRRRRDYAARILSVSLSAAAPCSTNLAKYVGLALLVAFIYSCFWIAGIGGLISSRVRLAALFLVALLISMAWTMHVIRNVLHATIARVGYLYFACGAETEARLLLRCMDTGSIGSVCLGSAIVPVIGFLRGVARTMTLVAGDTDEFMFSCVNCYAGVAERLMANGNRWGFVHVGMFGKAFVQASADTWRMLVRAGMEHLIDADLTGSFCFLCGVAGGSLCALVGGMWALTVEKSYATSVLVYAFLIGYFMSRIAMSWPQACVSAYYVAYADNPGSPLFDSTIPVRIQQLQRS